MLLAACTPAPAPVPAPSSAVEAWAVSLLPSPEGWTFQDLARDEDPNDDFMPFLPLAQGGTIEVRGQSTRAAAQKSYTIKRPAEPRHLLLNKHPFDLTRLRQKLCLDLFQELPELPAPRATFAGLTIDGKDFGLFTRVERIDDAFMAARGLPAKGFLYQAKDFDFHRRQGVLEDVGTPGFDTLSFEGVLEVKGQAHHAALLAMLDDVADPAQDAKALLAKHFDQANYLTWLAANMLVGNQDTATQNMFLAAGPAGDPWRLLPWDYDQALGWAEQPGGAVKPADVPARDGEGIGLYWRSPLHRRVFQDPDLLAALTRRVEELAAGPLAPSRVAARAAALKELVRPWLARDPDHAGLPGPWEAFDAEVDRLAATVERRQALYHEVLARPMPFQLVPAAGIVAWEPAVQLQGLPVTYDLDLAPTPDLAAPVVHQVGLTGTSFRPDVAPGRYYVRVVARTAGGAWQALHGGVAPLDLMKK